MDGDEAAATKALCLHNFIELKDAENVTCNTCMESIPNNTLIIKYHVFTTSHMNHLIVHLNRMYAQGIAVPHLFQDMRYFRIHKIIYINNKSIYCFVCSVKADLPINCIGNPFIVAADNHIHNYPKHAKYMNDMLNDLCNRGALQCLGVPPQPIAPVPRDRSQWSNIPKQIPMPIMSIDLKQVMPIRQPPTAIFQVPTVSQSIPNTIPQVPSLPTQPPPNISRVPSTSIAAMSALYQGSPLYTDVQTVEKPSPPPQQTEAEPVLTNTSEEKKNEKKTDSKQSDYKLMLSKFNFDIKKGDALDKDFAEMLWRNTIYSYMRSESQKYCNVCNLIVDIDELKSHLLSDEHYENVKPIFSAIIKENKDRTLGEIFNIDPATLKETVDKVYIENNCKELFKLLDDYWCEVISGVENEFNVIFEKNRQSALQNYGCPSPALKDFVSRLNILYSVWLHKNGDDNAELNANDDLYGDVPEIKNTSLKEPENVKLEPSVEDFFGSVCISPSTANSQLHQPKHPEVNTVPIVKPAPVAKPTQIATAPFAEPTPIAKSTPIAKPAPITEPAVIAKTNTTPVLKHFEMYEEIATMFDEHRIELISDNIFKCHVCSIQINSIINTIKHISGRKHESSLGSPKTIKSSTPSDDSDSTYKVNAHVKNKIQSSDNVMRFINPAKVTTERRKSQTNLEQNIQTVDIWRKPFNEEVQFQIKTTPYQGTIKKTPPPNERNTSSEKTNSGNNSPISKKLPDEQKKRSTLFQTHYIYHEGEAFRCKICDQRLSTVTVAVDHIITTKHRANLQTMGD